MRSVHSEPPWREKYCFTTRKVGSTLPLGSAASLQGALHPSKLPHTLPQTHSLCPLLFLSDFLGWWRTFCLFLCFLFALHSLPLSLSAALFLLNNLLHIYAHGLELDIGLFASLTFNSNHITIELS